jgi:hypothetical protein
MSNMSSFVPMHGTMSSILHLFAIRYALRLWLWKRFDDIRWPHDTMTIMHAANFIAKD